MVIARTCEGRYALTGLYFAFWRYVGYPGIPAKFFLADTPPNYHEFRRKNLEVLGVAIRD
jgi:hypothetical protein